MKKTYYSDYYPLVDNDPSTLPNAVQGTALMDATSTEFAKMFSTAPDYPSSGTFPAVAVGKVYSWNGSIWRCKAAITAGTNSPPPSDGSVYNAYWELVGAKGTFTWIAYASNITGTADFTTGAYDTNGIIRKYIGIATNKNTLTESSDYTKYTWSKFAGDDGATGVSPVTASLTNPTTTIPTDSDGNNAVFTGAGTDIYVYEGTTLLTYNGVGTSAGTWKVSSVAPTNVSTVTISSVGTSPNTFGRTSTITSITQDTGLILYTITGKNSAGTGFTIPITQNFSRVKGAIIDTISPSAPTGLGYSTSTVAMPGGSIQVRLKASWTAPTTNDVTPATTLTDLSYYEVSIKLTSDLDSTYVSYQTSTTSYEWIVSANTAYTVKVVAVDKSGNRSTALVGSSTTSGSVTTPPSGAPKGISAIATFKSVFLKWTNISDSDLGSVEVWRNTSNNSSTATKVGTVNVAPSTIGAFTDSSNLTNGTLYYYWLKSVNTSGIVSSAFSTVVSSILTGVTITDTAGGFTCTDSTTLSGVVIAGTAGQFTCTSTSSTILIGQSITISGTYGGTGSITGYSTPKTYIVSATNGSTSFTLINTDGSSIVTTAGTPTGLTFTRNVISIGQVVIVSGTLSGTGSITGYSPGPKSYVVSVTNGTTSFTLINIDGTPIVTTIGTLTGLTFTKYQSAAVPAAVGTADIIAGSITADLIRTGELTADLISVPVDPNKGLNPSIKIGNTGVTIDTVRANAADPATKINNGTTTIDPGMVTVTGTQTIQSTVANWVYPNKTTIDGGSIQSRTISADKVEVGLAGVQFISLVFQVDATIPNRLNWFATPGTGASVVYVNDSGAAVTSALSDGYTDWTTGTTYLYWVKPITGTITPSYSGTTITLTFPAQTDLALPFYVDDIILVSGITATTNAPNGVFKVTASTATTVQYTAVATPTGTLGGTVLIKPSISASSARGNAYRANAIPIGTYIGGRKYSINYGKTIINGADITTGSIVADQIATNSITADRIDSTGLSIKDASGNVILAAGTPLTWTNISTTGIPASVDNGQSGINKANIQYSEFNQYTVPTLTYTSSTAGYSSAIDATSPPITGIGSIKLTSANTGSAVAYAFLGVSTADYNIVLKPNTTYLLSAYVKSTTASASGSLRFRLNDVGSDTTPVAFTTSSTVSTWTRVSGKFTTNSSTTSGIARLANLTNNCSIWYSGIMVEEASGSSVTSPSPYTAPSITGQITSSNISTYIQDAAIGSAQIGSIALVGTGNFSVKTSTTSTASRMEMDSQVIKIFEGSTLRIKLGNLA